MSFVKYLLVVGVWFVPLHADFVRSEHFKTLEKKYGSQVPERALSACKKIWELKPDLALTKQQLFSLCLFIEAKLSSRIDKHQFYLRKERTKLARTIEYDPKTKRTFIHLKRHGIDGLGKGWHKRVTYSIMYSSKNPQLVANSVLAYNTDSRREIALLNKLKKQRGLASTYSISTHAKKGSKRRVVSIIQKLYNARSLHHYQQNPQILTKKQIVLIAQDLICGLEELHRHNLVHRDLHGGNILLDQDKKGHYKAAIIDFGQTRYAKYAASYGPLIEVPKRFNPPDAFWRDKTTIKGKPIDVYALGLNLYHLYFGKQPEWAYKPAFANILKLSKNGKVGFRKKLTNKMHYYLQKRRKSIKSASDPYGKFERLILQMCHPTPYRRGTARQIHLKLDQIVKSIQASF